MCSNVRRYVEYSSPTIGGVGAAFAPHFARLKHEFTKSSSECDRLSRKSLCQRILHITFVRARSIVPRNHNCINPSLMVTENHHISNQKIQILLFREMATPLLMPFFHSVFLNASLFKRYSSINFPFLNSIR